MRNDLMMSCLISLMVDDHLRITEHSTKTSWYNFDTAKKHTFSCLVLSEPCYNMHDIHRFCYGMSKETFAPITMMKIMHLQNREQITF